jgi:hypothetical protein
LQLERFEQTSKQLPKDLWTTLQRSVKFNKDFACVNRSLDDVRSKTLFNEIVRTRGVL